MYDEALTPFGVNIAQFSLLRTIQYMQPVSLTDLGRIAQLERSTVGRNVKVLERLGLVTSGRSTEDQREAMVTLTKQGEKLLTDSSPVWDACQQKIEDRLGPERIAILRNILADL
jgi:DNA-binding MarR family transcriptional regulator